MAPPARSTTPRQRHLPAPSLTLDELLEQSAWFSRLDAAAQLQVRANATERPVAAGQSLSHHGDRQHAWFGVLEGLIKWAITARDGRTVTLGGQSVGSWFGEGTLLRGERWRYDVLALRPGTVAGIGSRLFAELLDRSVAFNRYLMNQLNERLAQFIEARDRPPGRCRDPHRAQPGSDV